MTRGIVPRPGSVNRTLRHLWLILTAGPEEDLDLSPAKPCEFHLLSSLFIQPAILATRIELKAASDELVAPLRLYDSAFVDHVYKHPYLRFCRIGTPH